MQSEHGVSSETMNERIKALTDFSQLKIEIAKNYPNEVEIKDVAGYGTIEYGNHKYIGETDAEDKPHGYGVFYYDYSETPEYCVIWAGQFKHGRINGLGRKSWPKIDWKNNMKIERRDSDLPGKAGGLEGFTRTGKNTGTIKRRHETYIGEVDENGKEHGYGTITWPGHSTYTGWFKHGEKHGKGKEIDHSAGDIVNLEEYNDGAPINVSYTFEKNNIVTGCQYTNDVTSHGHTSNSLGKLGTWKDFNYLFTEWVPQPTEAKSDVEEPKPVSNEDLTAVNTGAKADPLTPEKAQELLTQFNNVPNPKYGGHNFNIEDVNFIIEKAKQYNGFGKVMSLDVNGKTFLNKESPLYKEAVDAGYSKEKVIALIALSKVIQYRDIKALEKNPSIKLKKYSRAYKLDKVDYKSL